jgi:hypothetical protein
LAADGGTVPIFPTINAVFSFSGGRFFDQGERVFEVVFLMLWLAFVVFLAYAAVRFVRENTNKTTKSRRKRRDHPASAAHGWK